jgi:hypothetical protein
MSKVLEGVVSDDSDIEKVFVYRGLRLGIGKPFFSNERGASKDKPIRSLGIINEDGRWVYYVSDLDQDLATAEWQARHYVVGSMIDEGVLDGKYDRPDQQLYRELQLLTNQSSDKVELKSVVELAYVARSALDDAWSYVKRIKNPELQAKARQAVLDVASFFEEDD